MTSPKYQSELLKTLSERGFIRQCTDETGLDTLLANARISAYIGFDCTAPSLHVGSLIQIMLLRWLQKCGHKPIVLLGGGTTKVGDPSGKDAARKMLTESEIEQNKRSLSAIFSQFLRLGDGPMDAKMVDNAAWLDGLNYLGFLRDYGQFFSVNRMLTQDSVKLRLEREQNLSLLEFSYMVLQAYDFVVLNEREGVRLQVGGSDQWGNIIMGVELARRVGAQKRCSLKPLDAADIRGATLLQAQPMIHSQKSQETEFTSQRFIEQFDGAQSKELFGLTTPLMATSSGAKMGKTADGAIWLHPDYCTPYQYWQFWRNTEDADVGRFLRLFTELPMAEIARLETLQGAEINEAKKILATEATRLCHGDYAAQRALESSTAAFEQSDASKLPVFELSAAALGAGILLYDLLRAADMADSGNEAKRLIRGGGAKVNDQKITDEQARLTLADFGDAKALKLTAGKKRHVLVKLC